MAKDIAHARLAESLSIAHAAGDRRAMALALEGLARLAAAQGRTQRAWQAAAVTAAWSHEWTGLASWDQAETPYLRLPAISGTLIAPAQGMAAAEGQTITLEQAVAYALDEQHPA
jgi:hypothetical protein